MATESSKNPIDIYLHESKGLERDYLSELIISREKAWKVAYGMGLVVLIALLACFFSFYRSDPVPHVLRVDNATGAVEVLTQVKTTQKSYGEVVDSYWLNQYILNREGYDHYSIQSLYDTTALLSSEDVQREYYQLFDGKGALDKKLGDHTRILVDVRSITPNIDSGTAVIRFSTRMKSSHSISKPKHFIATIGYEYLNANMSVKDRRLNPLGFQITSYRKDPEVISEKGGR